jgi:hypothetical protein
MVSSPEALPEALVAGLVFRIPEAARNRNFAVHQGEPGARARKRAARLRGLLQQIVGAFGPAHRVAVETHEDGELTLRYALAKLGLLRSARMSVAELSILRVALARAGARLLPAALVAREEDKARVEALLASVRAASVTH